MTRLELNWSMMLYRSSYRRWWISCIGAVVWFPSFSRRWMPTHRGLISLTGILCTTNWKFRRAFPHSPDAECTPISCWRMICTANKKIRRDFPSFSRCWISSYCGFRWRIVCTANRKIRRDFPHSPDAEFHPIVLTNDMHSQQENSTCFPSFSRCWMPSHCADEWYAQPTGKFDVLSLIL